MNFCRHDLIFCFLICKLWQGKVIKHDNLLSEVYNNTTCVCGGQVLYHFNIITAANVLSLISMHAQRVASIVYSL